MCQIHTNGRPKKSVNPHILIIILQYIAKIWVLVYFVLNFSQSSPIARLIFFIKLRSILISMFDFRYWEVDHSKQGETCLSQQKVSISATFYEQILCTIKFLNSFLVLHFMFCKLLANGNHQKSSSKIFFRKCFEQILYVHILAL